MLLLSFCSVIPLADTEAEGSAVEDENSHKESLCVSSDTLNFINLLCKNGVFMLEKSMLGYCCL